MQAPSDLITLAKLRSSGKAPCLPVFVTHDWGFASRMRALGALAIVPSAECDWRPLAGMDVILAFPDWPENTPLMRAIRAARPRRLRIWADGEFSTMWYSREAA